MINGNGPSVSGLVSEAEKTVPPVDGKRSDEPVVNGNAVAGPSKIKLSSNEYVQRPKVHPNKEMYSRLPPHLLLPDGTPSYLPLLLTSAVYSVLPASGTPLTPAVSMSTRLGNEILFKREDLTPVFSFKIRGAFNLMSQLSSEERWRGVIACSAGNHAQGVALAGNKLGIACTIVMPLNTPSIKWLNVERMGAKVVLHGADFDEAKQECARLAKVHGLTQIPPFDDPYVLAGQGTCGVEILRQTDANALDAIFVPVGGGGLLAGILAYIKQIAPPHLKVIGVETYDADALAKSLRAGQRVTLKEVGLFADGTAVRLFGDETYRLCAEYVDEIVLVSNDEICAAVKDVFEDTRSVAEPSGAMAVAGVRKYIQQNGLTGAGKRFVAVVSGANINFSRLRFIAERAEVGEGREAMLRVTIPEQPGAFLKLHTCIHPRAVTEFVYRYSSPKSAHVFMSFYLSSVSSAPSNPNAAAAAAVNGQAAVLAPHEARARELDEIMSTMRQGSMDPLDISDNELAKSHARYLVGGRSRVAHERMIRFEFPERPNALRKFLESLESRLNISLFHYRNHGGDVAKIMCGIQVPPGEEAFFAKWLQALNYPFVDETDNPVYRDFLGGDYTKGDDE